MTETKNRHIVRRMISLILALAIGFGAGYYVSNSMKWDFEDEDDSDSIVTEKRSVTAEDISAKLVEIKEISTYSCEYTVKESVDSKRFLLDDIAIPLTKNKITISCDGIVKVGYDIDEIKVSVDDVSQTVYIGLPQAKLNDNYIIWETVKCKETNNILNPIDFDDYQKLIGELEAKGLAAAEENGIYTDAEQNMKMIIINFLAEFDGYKVEFL